MPDRPPNRFERARRLSDAHAGGELVKLKCGFCYGRTRFYFPSDLIRLLGDVPVYALRAVMKCEACGHKEYLDTDTVKPSAADRQGMKVRRLVEVKVRKLPVWRED